MTPQQISLIQGSFAKVAPISEQAAVLFYRRLFELDPNLRALFDDTDMAAQGAKLMRMIGTVVNGLDNLGALVPAIQDLGRRHVNYGVEAPHYDTVGAALLWTLDQGLGDDFTPEVQEAWTAAYGVLAATMKDAAAEVA